MSAKQAPLLDIEKLQPIALEAALQEGRGAFVSAASGLVRRRGRLHVIADDEIALFTRAEEGPWRVRPLGKLDLPVDPKARKAVKPDFESLVLLDEKQWPPHGALVAWPSASTPRRMKAYVLPFRADDQPGAPLIRDIQAWATKLQGRAGELNIEGLFLHEGRACFTQRGNAAQGRNGIFSMPLDVWIAGLKSGQWPAGVETEFHEIKMGRWRGVRLSLTDVISTSRGLLGLASAEDTDSAYADGEVVGSVLVRLDPEPESTSSRAEILGRFPASLKLEGLAVEKEEAGGVLHLLLVDDADDPARPSHLYRLILN